MANESSWEEVSKQLDPQQRTMFETMRERGMNLIEDVRQSDLPHDVQGVLVSLFAYACMGSMATTFCEELVRTIRHVRGEP